MNEKRPRQQALPFSAGRDWVQSAIALIRSQLLRLLVLGLVLQLIGGLSQVGVLGLLFILAMPAFSAGMLEGIGSAARGERPSLGALFAAFRGSPRLGRLLLLGLLGLAVILTSASLVLAGGLAGLDPELMVRLEAGEVDAVNELDPAILSRIVVGLLAGLLISGTLSFYAVPLIWFGGAPLGRAIGQGLAGMLRQWRALLLMGLLLGLLGIPVVVLASWALTAQLIQGSLSPVLTVVMLLAAVAYQLLLFATQFTSYAAIFGPAPGPANPAGTGRAGEVKADPDADDPRDQLVA